MCIFRCIWSLMQLQISNSSEFLLHICVIRTKRVQLKFNWVFHLLGFALYSPENVSRKFRAPCHMESEHGKCFRQAPLECKQHSMMRISIWGARSWLWRDASSLPLSHSLSLSLFHSLAYEFHWGRENTQFSGRGRGHWRGRGCDAAEDAAAPSPAGLASCKAIDVGQAK